MGNRPTRRSRDGFTGVLPATAQPNGTPPIVRSRESASDPRKDVNTAIPSISTPPHALLQPETPRRSEPTVDDAFAVPESVRKSTAIKSYEQECSEILPDLLFVSNLHVAQDVSLLTSLWITHVINCCQEITCLGTDTTRQYLNLALRDGVQEDLLPFFPTVVKFVEDCRVQGGKMLVHCHMGISRSCACVIAYVMYHKHLSFRDAMALVKTQRTICSPNTAFICQLIEWERELASFSSDETALPRGLYRLAPHAAYDTHTFVLKSCYQGNSRQQVLLESDTDSSRWLWSKGLFVYVNEANQVVIWKGAQCSIPDATVVARVLVERKAHVLLGEEVTIDCVIAEQATSAVSSEEVDHFGYAEELSWLQPSPPSHNEGNPVAKTTPPALTQASLHDSHVQDERKPAELAEVDPVATVSQAGSKPTLFLLERVDPNAWEQLTDYSSDDLTSGNVLLLVSTPRPYVWMGRDCGLPNESVLKAAYEKLGTGMVAPQIIRQDEEDNVFWDVFEAGY